MTPDLLRGWFPPLPTLSAPSPGPDGRPAAPPIDPARARRAGALTAPFTARLLAGIDRGPVNAVCSPVSAQIALTMAGLGARGVTRTQMERVLGGSIEALTEAAATLTAVLADVGAARGARPREDAADPATASLADGVWVQAGLEVERSYREDLSSAFGVAVQEADFTDATAREAGRREINDWVEAATHGLIEELVPAGALSAEARLVLVNTLHLKAAWTKVLTPCAGTFTAASGEKLPLQMLRGGALGWYEDEHCRATALRTAGGELALALVQPVVDVGSVLDAWAVAADAEGSAGTDDPEGAAGTDDPEGATGAADAARSAGTAASAGPDGAAGLATMLGGLDAVPAPVELTLPGFDIGWADVLNEPLAALGMVDALDSRADFTGIAQAELTLSVVLQKAVITVDAEGMEAAAATAVVTRAGAAAAPPPRRLMLDSPFLIVAYERTTLAPLVVGWIGDPTQTR